MVRAYILYNADGKEIERGPLGDIADYLVARLHTTDDMFTIVIMLPLGVDMKKLSKKDSKRIFEELNLTERVILNLKISKSDAKGCSTCLGHGLWADKSGQPMGPIDAADGMLTRTCPECGASTNPKGGSKKKKKGRKKR